MKSLKIVSCLLILGIICMSSSCKKEYDKEDDEYIKGWTRVIGVKGTDSSSTAYINARVETTGLIMVQDAQLKAELISYTPLSNGRGQYIVRMTNKQSCQVILRWSYEGLTIDDWSPSNDVLTANQVVEFTLIGDAKPGRIKVKAEKSNSECSNSSTLVLEITNIILPIEYTNFKVERKGSNMYVMFSTETPEDADWFFVLWSPDGTKVNEKVVAHVESDHATKNHRLSFPARKKEDFK